MKSTKWRSKKEIKQEEIKEVIKFDKLKQTYKLLTFFDFYDDQLIKVAKEKLDFIWRDFIDKIESGDYINSEKLKFILGIRLYCKISKNRYV